MSRTTRLRIGQIVGPCAQRRVALMPRAIATARDALLNDRRKSAARFEKPAKQALALATEPQAKREARSGSNVRAERERCHCTLSWSCLLCQGVWPLQPLPSAHAHGTNGQSCPGRILFVHELCLYVL